MERKHDRKKKLYGFHCDTPEHLHVLFYGFDKCMTIKKCTAFPCRRDCEYYFLYFSFTPIVGFWFCLYCLLASDSFNYFRLPYYMRSLPFAVIYTLLAPFPFLLDSLARSYRFPGNCCASQQQPCCHSVISDMTVPLSPTFVSEPRVRENIWRKKQPKENTLKMRECVDIVQSIETILKKY